jgi:hypothetical protein
MRWCATGVMLLRSPLPLRPSMELACLLLVPGCQQTEYLPRWWGELLLHLRHSFHSAASAPTPCWQCSGGGRGLCWGRLLRSSAQLHRLTRHRIRRDGRAIVPFPLWTLAGVWGVVLHPAALHQPRRYIQRACTSTTLWVCAGRHDASVLLPRGSSLTPVTASAAPVAATKPAGSHPAAHARHHLGGEPLYGVL